MLNKNIASFEINGETFYVIPASLIETIFNMMEPDPSLMSGAALAIAAKKIRQEKDI